MIKPIEKLQEILQIFDVEISFVFESFMCKMNEGICVMSCEKVRCGMSESAGLRTERELALKTSQRIYIYI